jgi:hypothetical protein
MEKRSSDKREKLEELAERLRTHEGPGKERATELHGAVRKAIDEDDHEGLGDRLTEEAVEFEDAHPDLANFLRRFADYLAAAGI